MLNPRKLDRIVMALPLSLKSISRVTFQFSKENKLARSFIRDYIPLMAQGNPHIEFLNRCVEDKREFCNVQLEDGTSRVFNLKFYMYPNQLMQRILDLTQEN